MRNSLFAWLGALVVCAVAACSDPATPSSSSSSSSTGGKENPGGAASAGGVSSAGGASSTSSTSSGAGGVNLACGSDPSLTPQEQQLIALPADTWFEVPNTHFEDICGANEPAGAHTTGGCTSIINAWGGGAWDPIHSKMILWGGGHNDYWGNEVYAFSTKTFKWELLVPGTAIGSGDDLTEPMADGTPVSRHTYDGLAYLTAENRLFAFGGATAPSGYTSTLTWELDVENKIWKQVDPGHTLPPDPNGYYWMGSAYDEAGHRVFMRNESGVYSYDLTTNAWTRLLDGGYPPFWPNWAQDAYRRGIFDTKRKIFFTLGGTTGEGKLDFFAWDAAANKLAYDDWGTTGGDELAKANGPGADYDSAADTIVAWAGGAPRALDLTTKAWSTKSAVGAPPKPVDAGTYGRFRYIPRYNVFVLVNRWNENVYFYKHTAGCGP
jgi:hypothetical protein